LSNIVGERCHVIDERGEWCAVVNDAGVYLQTLVIPSEQEILKEQEHQSRIQTEQGVETTKETRKQELKNKLDSGEALTLQELTELLKLAL
jgi:flagellar hook protein FlgE